MEKVVENTRGKPKNITFKDFIIGLITNIGIEVFEFSIGLVILWKINLTANQNINLFESVDFLIATLIYIVISIKSLGIFLIMENKEQKTKRENLYNASVIYKVVCVVFITLDTISLKEGKIIDFKTSYIFLFGAFFIKGMERFVKVHYQNLSEKLKESTIVLQESYKKQEEEVERLHIENEKLKKTM